MSVCACVLVWCALDMFCSRFVAVLCVCIMRYDTDHQLHHVSNKMVLWMPNGTMDSPNINIRINWHIDDCTNCTFDCVLPAMNLKDAIFSAGKFQKCLFYHTQWAISHVADDLTWFGVYGLTPISHTRSPSLSHSFSISHNLLVMCNTRLKCFTRWYDRIGSIGNLR